MRKLMLWLIVLSGGGVMRAESTWAAAVAELNLTELAATFDSAKVAHWVGPAFADATTTDRQALAVLVAMGVVETLDLSDPARVQAQVGRYRQTLQPGADARLVPLRWPHDLARMPALGGHDALRQEGGLIEALNAALGQGVITGYGLRKVDVSAASDPERTLVYSHNRWRHVQQLVGLMASEGLEGLVYLTPKVSAFLYRDGWGERPDGVAELGPGLYAAQSEEWLIHFEFKRAEDRFRFDELVTRYAKKDAADETGNIAHAWWQPFYYSEVPMAGFFEIGRVTLRAERTEVLLLALAENVAQVRDHFGPMRWPMTVDRLWVPGPFYRFLLGDYK